MKKLSFVAVAFAAMIFASCTGGQGSQNKGGEQTDSVKSFEQEQLEASIKIQFDSLASELGKLKTLPILNKDENGIQLSDQEKQVKPDYLLDPAVAENATTLAEKYRILSALVVDKKVAELYEMPTDDYDKAITKLVADISDPSFKDMEDQNTIYETNQTLYDAMNANGRINYYWQMAAAVLVEQLYVLNQNTDKFITAFDDDAAANVTFRIILLQDAIERLSAYDTELIPVVQAIEPLKVLNAIDVEQLKEQLAQIKDEINAARQALVK
jgi:hypothetical protein